MKVFILILQIMFCIFVLVPSLGFWLDIINQPEDTTQWGMYSFNDILDKGHKLSPEFKAVHQEFFGSIDVSTTITQAVAQEMIHKLNNTRASNPKEYLSYITLVGYVDYIMNIMLHDDWTHPTMAIYKEILNARLINS